MPKKQKPLAPKTQAAVDEFAKKLAELLLEEGVELDELVRIDERVLPLVRRIGNKALEELAKKKVDSTVKQNEELGLKVHRSKMIEFEYIFGAVAIESPYLWLKECGGIRPTSEKTQFITKDTVSVNVEMALPVAVDCLASGTAGRFLESSHSEN